MKRVENKLVGTLLMNVVGELSHHSERERVEERWRQYLIK